MLNLIKRYLARLGLRATKKVHELDRFFGDVRGVIHVGANTGQERDLYDSFGLDVIWIEPIPEVFAELEKNTADFPKQRAFRRIFTDRSGQEIELKIANNNGAASSILDIGDLTDIWPEIEYTDVLRMTSQTLGDFLEAEAVDVTVYDALVMDTQGSELLVLKGAGDRIAEFRYIKTEAADFDAYRGCCQVEDLAAYLARFGFAELRRHAFADNGQGGRYYDVLFAREG